MKKRVLKRIRKHLQTEFWIGDHRFRGTASNLSDRGFFIKTQQGFKVGLIVNMKITLPDERVCFLKGIVRNVRKKLLLKQLNGMGIELLETDLDYIDYIKKLNEYKPHSLP